MATKKELLKMIEKYDQHLVVVVSGKDGGWDNIQNVKLKDDKIIINFGGGSPFNSDK